MSDNIIEGLLVDVSGEQLIKHCQERAEWHASQCQAYAGKVELFHRTKANVIQESGSFDKDEFRRRLDASNFKGDVNETQLERAGKGHENQANIFRFFAEHFVTGATYRLNLQELKTLEVAKGDIY